MSDQQPTSWRDRFFGTAPEPREQPEGTDAGAVHDSAELAPDSSEVAATSVEEHDEHQPLVEHEGEADTAELRTAPDEREQPIEPTVIAPSSLRGPSHSAAHPDDAPRASAEDVHGDAATTSLEREPGGEAAEPPPLVEPRRPSFGLRRHGDG
ncbi:hypothetical protein, partial [Agrococcus sp. HG114]|uniref:hypothetical protein n=1 Tax=Agrococcus sp. HG114 TaxID=2969757 RepID=UPI00215B6BD4